MSRNFELLQQMEHKLRAGNGNNGGNGARPQLEMVAAPPVPPRPRTLAADMPIAAALRPGVGLPQRRREELARLAQRLFLMPGARCSAVAFCGVEDAGGSSWVSAGAADALAQQTNRHVCVLDANVRIPLVHAQFGLGNQAGFTTRLQHPGPLRQLGTRVAENLWVIPAGPPAEDWPTPFSAEALQAYISELRHDFEFVLVNVAPVVSHNDALLIGQAVDGVVLVLEADMTRRELAQHAKNALTQAGVSVLGAVLNNREFPIPDRLYARL
jgi:Mrp family chromosome partitioning ATPase